MLQSSEIVTARGEVKAGPEAVLVDRNSPTCAKKFRVLLLGPYPPPYGGVEISLVALRDALLQQGIGCEVVNLTRHRRASGGGIHYPSSAAQVVKLLVAEKREIIHLHIGGDVSWRLLGLGFLCSVLPGRRLFLTLHSGGYPSSPAGRMARPASVRGFLLRRFDGMIAVNRDIADMFARFGVPQSRIRTIPPFALPGKAPEAALPESMRAFFKLHSPVLLTVSGLEPEYQLSLQIDLLECIRTRHPKAGLLIIGSGSREMEIRRTIRAKTYADDILLATDVSHEIVLRAMAEADVFLRTTLYDGDSISVREALHVGVPVVATDNGMRPGGVCLTPLSDREAICRAVHGVLSGRRVRRNVMEADMTNLLTVIDFYKELLDRKDVRAASQSGDGRPLC